MREILTVIAVPFSKITVLFSVIATIAILKFTRRAYMLKNPRNARNATT